MPTEYELEDRDVAIIARENGTLDLMLPVVFDEDEFLPDYAAFMVSLILQLSHTNPGRAKFIQDQLDWLDHPEDEPQEEGEVYSLDIETQPNPILQTIEEDTCDYEFIERLVRGEHLNDRFLLHATKGP